MCRVLCISSNPTHPNQKNRCRQRPSCRLKSQIFTTVSLLTAQVPRGLAVRLLFELIVFYLFYLNLEEVHNEKTLWFELVLNLNKTNKILWNIFVLCTDRLHTFGCIQLIAYRICVLFCWMQHMCLSYCDVCYVSAARFGSDCLLLNPFCSWTFHRRIDAITD